MPAIGDMEYGFDSAGVETYIDQIKAIVLTQAKAAVENTSAIEQCCMNEWEGKARDNFLENLRKDTKHVGENFEALYNALVAEINSTKGAMQEKDEKLIELS